MILFTRTSDGAVRTEDAAIARLWSQYSFAFSAFVKELARIGGHHLFPLEAAVGTSYHRCEDDHDICFLWQRTNPSPEETRTCTELCGVMQSYTNLRRARQSYADLYRATQRRQKTRWIPGMPSPQTTRQPRWKGNRAISLLQRPPWRAVPRPPGCRRGASSSRGEAPSR